MIKIKVPKNSLELNAPFEVYLKNVFSFLTMEEMRERQYSSNDFKTGGKIEKKIKNIIDDASEEFMGVVNVEAEIDNFKESYKNILVNVDLNHPNFNKKNNKEAVAKKNFFMLLLLCYSCDILGYKKILDIIKNNKNWFLKLPVKEFLNFFKEENNKFIKQKNFFLNDDFYLMEDFYNNSLCSNKNEDADYIQECLLSDKKIVFKDVLNCCKIGSIKDYEINLEKEYIDLSFSFRADKIGNYKVEGVFFRFENGKWKIRKIQYVYKNNFIKSKFSNGDYYYRPFVFSGENLFGQRNKIMLYFKENEEIKLKKVIFPNFFEWFKQYLSLELYKGEIYYNGFNKKKIDELSKEEICFEVLIKSMSFFINKTEEVDVFFENNKINKKIFNKNDYDLLKINFDFLMKIEKTYDRILELEDIMIKFLNENKEFNYDFFRKKLDVIIKEKILF